LRNLGKRLLRWLLLGHRWLGIATALLFAVWFLSGAVMMYVGFPRLTEAERRAALPPLALSSGLIGPDAAFAAARQTALPARIDLGMLGDEPVYRIQALDGTRTMIAAADGRRIERVDSDRLLRIAAGHPAARAVEDLGAILRDQWTVPQRYDPLRPFRLVALGDAAGTRLYLSERTGEIALDTTRAERFWNWLGAVPHWIYLTPLRAEPALWRDVVLWVSGLAIAVAASGTVLGLSRLRLRPRYANGRTTPYRGIAAWHHLGGLIGGTALLTFIVSGWLSMNPNRWFSPNMPDPAALARYLGPEAAVRAFDPEVARTCPDLKEIRFVRVGDAPLTLAICGEDAPRPCCGTAAPDPENLHRALARLMPGEAPPRIERIEAEDSYWYGPRETRPLPVLRAVFADPAATWIHIDPTTGEILGRINRSNRVSRWLFNGLHTLDLAVLRRRPVWDAVMALWLSAGFLVAVTGLIIGWRRLRRRFG
jgi:hypothetical protein